MAESGIKEPKTLCELLEFLSKLEESSVKTKVIEEIKVRVKKYVKDAEQKFGTLFLPKTIEKCKKLRSDILKKGKDTEYQHYTQSSDDDKLNESRYTENLIDNIFPLFVCLYYMYFECSNGCTYFDGGGKWQSETCDGNGGGQYLNKWLRDLQGQEVKDLHRNPLMIKRGFKSHYLGEKDGKALFPNSSSNALLYYREAAQLQSALFFMLFLPHNWSSGQSAHALLFLDAFCEKVTESEVFFKDHKHDGISMEDLKSSCQGLKTKISAITKSEIIAPVAWKDTVKYKDLMDEKRFGSYITWLKQNLQGLITSLTEMASDIDNWDEAKLKTSNTYGPYPWGFTFQSHWEEQKAQLNELLQELSSSLSGLRNALPSAWNGKRRSKKAHEKSSNPTDSIDSSASTVGRVIGGVGAAAATAGAAYAGSSFLGPVAEGVGKFVRGLFF